MFEACEYPSMSRSGGDDKHQVSIFYTADRDPRADAAGESRCEDQRKSRLLGSSATDQSGSLGMVLRVVGDNRCPIVDLRQTETGGI
jgi:hypothetical protein